MYLSGLLAGRVQCVRLERAVAVRARNHRPIDRRRHPLSHSTALARARVGRQQIHQETARAQRHRQQRTSRLPVTRAFQPRTGPFRFFFSLIHVFSAIS